MNISPVTSESSKPAPSLWGQGEMPLGPPMSLDSPWVKSLQLLFPRENIELLSKHAGQLQTNMTRMISSEIQRTLKKARATAQKMKDAIMGRD